MDLSVASFIVPLITIFIGEMGDKTQLVTLCFATRFNVKVVLFSVFSASLLLNLFSVGLGQAITRYIGHEEYITITAGIAFIIFGIWTIKADDCDDETCENKKGSPFWAVFTTFILAEMGDKTMLSTIAVATQYNPLGVWLGATAGMMLADGLAIVVGMKLGKTLPEKTIKVAASMIFLLFGAYYIYMGVTGLLK